MESFIQKKGTIRLLKIDIDQWGSDVAKQHGIRSLPSLWLYDGTKCLSKNGQEVLKLIQQ